MSRWFRMYEGVLNDPKIQIMPVEDRWGWLEVLCFASSHDGVICDASGDVTGDVTELAFALRRSPSGVISLVERLASAGLIDRACGGASGARYVPHNWGKWQYKSDTSRERTFKWRERKRDVTVTPPDTEADTETEEKETSSPKKARSVVSNNLDQAEFDAWWKLYPEKVGKGEARIKYRVARKTASAENSARGGASLRGHQAPGAVLGPPNDLAEPGAVAR